MAQKPAPPAAPAKAVSRTPFVSSADKRRDALTHAQIAEDLAAFEQSGGKIEVLGNTPLRRAIPLAPSKPTSGEAEAPEGKTSP
jgi:hypothetical protein